ncbi:MAG: EAL domain-containing protein [Betaproteobacteria bacterium]|nr:EAL domain-containing protein [Betaproteobacteria bacterium]
MFEMPWRDTEGLGAFRANAEGAVVAANTQLINWLERPQDIAHASINELILGLDNERWHIYMAQLLASHGVAPFPAHLRITDDKLLPVEVHLTALPRPNAETEILGLLIPIGDRLQTEGVYELQKAVLEAVALGRPLKVVLDLLCRRVEALAPEVICSVVAVDKDGCLRPMAGPSLPAAYAAIVDGLKIGPKVGSCGTAAWRGEPVEVVDIASAPLWEDAASGVLPFGLAACWSTPFRGRDNGVVGSFALYYRTPRKASPFHRHMVEACVHLCSLAFEHEANQAEIRRLAFFDSLTGLPNRALLRDRVEQALGRMERNHNSLAMLFLDIDRFKTVNDSLGHAAGDRVLCNVAKRLLDAVRETDTVSRIGGDEFVVVLPDCDANAAQLVAEKLNQILAQHMELGDLNFAPSASIGISLYPNDATDFDTLLKNADIAMYQAKRDGRNCTRFFLKAMNEEADSRLELEAALHQALSQNQLQLYYQPKVWLDQPGIAGVEALIRWPHPQRGMVSPEQFIPLAEECGLINAIDAWVLKTACSQLAAWRAKGLAVPSMAVNLSATRFTQDDIPGHVRQILAHNNLNPADLTLEITERLVLEDSRETQSDLTRLRKLGVQLAIDDFGTGYSSLSYLTRFPVHELKLDRSFVQDIETNRDSRALALAVMGIGHSLALAVVAEGVETAGQHAILLAEGCNIAQGYFYARPMPAEAFETWLEETSKLKTCS